VDAAIIVVNDDTQVMAATSAMAALARRRVPVLGLTRTPGASECPFAAAAIPTLDLAAPPAAAAAMLAGLASRQPEVDELCRDIDMMQRYQGGLGLEMAKLHEELQLAAMVQRDFLPTPLEPLHGVSSDVLWRPANYVSGDIFDLVRLDDDHIGIFLADAVGHGVPAALMTMMIHQSLRTTERLGADRRLLKPSEVLGRLNMEMIRRHAGSSRFATAVYALLDCRSRTLTVAGAGHPPPLLLSADGSVSELDTPGSLLGIFPGEVYDDMSHELAVDDRLLIYSDGFEQAFPNAGHEAYSRRLPTSRYRDEFIRLREAGSAAEMIAELSHRVDQQRGSLHQIDDLTLICVHAAALGATTDVDAADPAVTA
ncbi:MAG: serine/threonine-protein phosphatase, partial [Phycisphaerales bacterium]|nr:serine/threonine-protein phosphatase [Phycisphaerales bacterium]